MPNDRVLILGGTGEARQLAAGLLAKGFEVISSLAGVTENPLLPDGHVRRGGFGGIAGLVAYLEAERIAAMVDATHPFAAQISAHAHAAAEVAGIPLLRLERPPWQVQDGDRWTVVPNIPDAVKALPAGARALVTIGRKDIGAFFETTDIGGVARMIEEQAQPAPLGWTVILQRPPFGIEQEKALITHHAITHLVTKNAGGTETEAKITAARALALPVIMVARPHKPAAGTYASADEVVVAVMAKLLP